MIKKWLGLSMAIAFGAASLPAFADEANRERFPQPHTLNDYSAPGLDQTPADSAAIHDGIGQ